jgi:polysaccharide export outer membrane protein
LGLTTEQIRMLVTERYSPFYANPLINVVVRVGVNVTGEVQRPNRYRVNPTSTILDVIAEAGGLTEEGRSNRVELVREGEVLILDLNSPTEGRAAQDLLVRSGDWIRVPRRRFSTQDAYWIFGALNFVTSVIILIAR